MQEVLWEERAHLWLFQIRRKFFCSQDLLLRACFHDSCFHGWYVSTKNCKRIKCENACLRVEWHDMKICMNHETICFVRWILHSSLQHLETLSVEKNPSGLSLKNIYTESKGEGNCVLYAFIYLDISKIYIDWVRISPILLMYIVIQSPLLCWQNGN